MLPRWFSTSNSTSGPNLHNNVFQIALHLILLQGQICTIMFSKLLGTFLHSKKNYAHYVCYNNTMLFLQNWILKNKQFPITHSKHFEHSQQPKTKFRDPDGDFKDTHVRRIWSPDCLVTLVMNSYTTGNGTHMIILEVRN